MPAIISELCCARLCWAVCHRLWSVTLTELSCARLCRAVYGYGLYGLLSELGCLWLCKAVTLMAYIWIGLCRAVHGCGLDGLIYILGCAITQPSVCHLFSWDGFQGVPGLCSLCFGVMIMGYWFWGDEVWSDDVMTLRWGYDVMVWCNNPEVRLWCHNPEVRLWCWFSGWCAMVIGVVKLGGLLHQF